MKKKVLVLLCIVLILSSGCTYIDVDADKKITPPENKTLSIRGVWNIKTIMAPEVGKDSSQKTDEWLNKKVVFNQNQVIFGDELYKDPHYKVKNVDAGFFFLHNYKLHIRDLGITNRRVEVVTVTLSEKLLYDFVKIDNDLLIVHIDQVVYQLVKISDISDSIINTFNARITNSKRNRTGEGREAVNTGVLLGLRSSGEKGYPLHKTDDKEEVFYRTLWISTINRRLHPVLEMSQLFLPRRTGFWKAGVIRARKNDVIRDSLFTYPVNNTVRDNSTQEKILKKEGSLIRRILFIGNDYIATEYTEKLGDRITPNRLEVFPVDNIESETGIRISEVLGEDGSTALHSSFEGYLSTFNKAKNDRLELVPREESFSIIRRNGHWIMKGRLNSDDDDDNDNGYIDFNINLVPPISMVAYDSLSIPWNTIKSRIPDAVDAFTSPNGDIALIVCRNAIYIYFMYNNMLEDKPVKKIDLQEGEGIVMAEWALGDYVLKWEKSFTAEISKK